MIYHRNKYIDLSHQLLNSCPCSHGLNGHKSQGETQKGTRVDTTLSKSKYTHHHKQLLKITIDSQCLESLTLQSIPALQSIPTLQSVQALHSVKTLHSVQTLKSVQTLRSVKTLQSVQTLQSIQTIQSEQAFQSDQTLHSDLTLQFVKLTICQSVRTLKGSRNSSLSTNSRLSRDTVRIKFIIYHTTAYADITIYL